MQILQINAVQDGNSHVNAYYTHNISNAISATSSNRTHPVSGRHYANKNSHEPIIEAISDHLQRTTFNIKGRNSNKSNPDYNQSIFICREDGTLLLPVILMKRGGHYYLNGFRSNKETLMTSLARVIYTSVFEWDGLKLNKLLLQNILLPENISYVLENRTPFHFIDPETNSTVNCRLNVKRVGSDVFAVELSDGIWGTLLTNELNTFVEFYWKNGRRGNWKMLSPRKLFRRTVGREPSGIEIKTMINFLKQNRTRDLVENRAKELMIQLEYKYPSRIKIVHDLNQKTTHMYVRGKRTDWMISGRSAHMGNQGSTQAVSTSHLASIDDEGQPLWRSHCIDNAQSNSSVGDQFCTRALATMNDDILSSMISTVDLDEFEDFQKEVRLENIPDLENTFSDFYWEEEWREKHENEMSGMHEDSGDDV